jgi:hypothetical protein
MYLRLISFLAFLLLVTTVSIAQPGDTFLPGIDTAKSIGQTEKEAQRWRDSIDAVRIRTNVQKAGKPLDAFLQEMREREKARKRQVYIRVGLVSLFLVVLIVGLLRRTKKM